MKESNVTTISENTALLQTSKTDYQSISEKNTTVEYTDPYPFEDFAPTLSQCFVLVLVGYLLSRLEILSASDVKGVLSLASYFAMPGIICISMMDADFGDFRWELMFGIFLGKLITFVVVAGFWILLKGNLGVAAVLALFCTQSNDLPVGNPLMSSLYREYRPQMLKYLFLIPAMTVIFFVPISNIMLNVHRKMRKKTTPEESDVRKNWWKHIESEDIVNQLCGIAKNPIVIATFSGIVLNFALHGHAPETLHRPIKVAAATIPGIALVMLGFSFVRKERYLLTSAVVPTAVLFLLKMVITPIMLHSIINVMTEESTSSNLLSDFVLLYGIVSPATAVFLSGVEFRKPLAVMSVTLILSSLTCFPVSYVVARATIAPANKLSSYVPILKRILFWTACISLCSDVICAITIIWKKQRQQISPFILYLIFTQAITCFGLIIWSSTEQQTWSVYCEMFFYYGGELSGYLWTGTLAVLLVSKNRNWMLAKRGFFIISCTAFSVSVLIATVMCLLMPYNPVQTVYFVARPRSNFEFLQLIMSSLLLIICLTVVIACLTCYFRNNGKSESKITGDYAYANSVFYIENREEIMQTQTSKEITWAEKVQASTKGKEEVNVGEEMMKSKQFNSGPSVEEREWTFRLSSLLILLGLVMLVRFVANLFKLVQSKALEVMIPMEFLQSTLFIGQGTLIMLTFGVDVRTIIISLRKCFRKITHKKDHLPTHSKVLNKKGEREMGPFCSQFCKFYYSRCFRDIAKERRWKENVYKDSFWGHQLVDWLITEGVCPDDVDAERQGQKLLEGGVITHVSQKHPFYDAPYLYQFVKRKWDSTVTDNCVKF